MGRNPILCAVSSVSQNMYSQSLNDFLFSLLENMLHSDTPLIVAIITEGCRIWEKNKASHPKILSIFTSQQHKFSPNVFFVHKSQHNHYWKMQDSFPSVCALYCYIVIQRFCQFSLRRNTNFHRFFFVRISQHNHTWKIQGDSFPLVCALYWYIVVVA